jgi:membrane protease YdiL (CAAX protease family)
VLGLLVVATVHTGLSLALLGGLARVAPAGALAPGTLGATPGVMAALLLSFGGLVVGVWVAVRLLHGRGLGSVIGHGPTALRHFAAGAGLLALVNGAALGAALLLAGGEGALAPVANLPPAVWLAWLPLALLGLAVQTGAEELVFRGYMQQQLAARFASPVIWAGLPSLLFGMLHYDPGTMGANVWAVVALTGLFGVMTADLTARSGTLGLAWGLHFANNLFALLLVAPMGALSGLALFTVPFGADDTGAMRLALAVDLVLLGLVWALCRRALRRG